MKNWMRKTIALLLALMLVTGAVAFAEKETVSDAFRLPSVSAKPAEKDEPAQEEPAGEPTVEEPVEDEPTEDEPVVEEPIEDEPAVEEPAEGEAPVEGEEITGEEVTDEEQTEVEPEGPVIIGKATVTLSDPSARLNVRAAADGDVIGSLDNGTVVSVLAEEGEWLKIVYGEGEGYVKASLTTKGAAEETPAEEPVEEPVEEEPVEEELAEEPVEEPTVEYLTDENGELILDENGNPIPVEPVEEEPVEEPVEEVVEEFEVSISVLNFQETYKVGDLFGLKSSISGICYEPAYQWQVLDSENEAAGWVDIPGATASVYEFELTAENFTDSYRVNVIDVGAPVVEEAPAEEAVEEPTEA